MPAVKKLKPIALNDSVSWTRRNGLPAEGKVVKFDWAPSGKWVHVETATKGQPSNISKVREATLRKGR